MSASRFTMTSADTQQWKEKGLGVQFAGGVHGTKCWLVVRRQVFKNIATMLLFWWRRGSTDGCVCASVCVCAHVCFQAFIKCSNCSWRASEWRFRSNLSHLINIQFNIWKCLSSADWLCSLCHSSVHSEVQRKPFLWFDHKQIFFLASQEMLHFVSKKKKKIENEKSCWIQAMTFRRTL